MIIKDKDWNLALYNQIDIVIVGAGAAGISLALACEKKNMKVVIIEGGGELYSESSQNFYNGISKSIRLPYGLKMSRLRFFGGSTNCWAGGCGELDDEDFYNRPWVKYSGWPIKKSDLTSWYEKAADFLNLDIKRIRNPEKIKGYPLFSGFDSRVLDFTKKVRFNIRFKDELKKSTHIKLLLNANLKKINRVEVGDTLKSMDVVSLSGESITLSATSYVLACGGIENARLLLNSKEKHRAAIGNNHDNVGRFFSDHPIAPCATVIGRKEPVVNLSLDIKKHNSGKDRYENFYKLPFSLQKKYKTLNAAVQFTTQEGELNEGEVSAWNLKKFLSNPSEYSVTIDDFINISTNFFDVSNSAYERLSGKGSRIAMRFQIEQQPNPESRITLSEKNDPIGQKRTLLNWKFTDMERHTINVLMANVAKQLQKSKSSTLKSDSQLINVPNKLPLDLRGGQHHSCTTRMSAIPEKGVVDSNLKIFGSKNFYVVGSSVFTTNGWVNPTFTIIALSIRLANHLSTKKYSKKSNYL